jgi:hypothetical protein
MSNGAPSRSPLHYWLPDPTCRVRTADQSAAGALTGGPEDRDSAGEGTGGTFSEKFSGSVRTVELRSVDAHLGTQRFGPQ